MNNMQTTKATVIYHKSDFDGIFCREIAKRFLPKDTTFIGWEYGEPEPSVSVDEELYILDLSVEGLMNHPKLVWIDHHKSAIDKYPTSIKGYRIDGVAACRLTWQWFRYLPLPDKEAYINRTIVEPLAVQLAGEYDIWDRRNPDAQLFQHGLRSQELTEKHWDTLLTTEKDLEMGKEFGEVYEIRVWKLLEQGKAIQYYVRAQNKSIILSQGFNLVWEGMLFLCLNSARCNSLSFEAGQKPEHDAFLAFKWVGDKWMVSMYHAEGMEKHDLSKIAVKYGGGGHKGACGFTCKELPFKLDK